MKREMEGGGVDGTAEVQAEQTQENSKDPFDIQIHHIPFKIFEQ